MAADQAFSNVGAFADALRELHARRRDRVISGRDARNPRIPLTSSERNHVLAKTNGHCHICGGIITGSKWQADHVLAHSAGGEHSAGNYLPTHSLCNNYRWHYDAEEFQWILKLGVWLRTQIERETLIGLSAGDIFCGHDRQRAKRRKLPTV
jgi:5-methylcytosine-specific restriction endonuclease McrA